MNFEGEFLNSLLAVASWCGTGFRTTRLSGFSRDT